MRSLELSLEGFTSFRSRQTLDFTNLDLFAITGPTGAGKTSLLDAITFALYGHVARFGKEAKAAELVSQGSQNLKVSFRFSVRGVEYRATRTWRYRPTTPESKVLLEQLQNDKWEKLETKEKSFIKRVEQILGMDFDVFTRVILLPQGKFDEFLKGNAAKRREILRQLAGFEIFERMRLSAQKQADLLKTEYEAVERQLNGLELPAISLVSEKQQELVTLEQQLPMLSEAVLKAQKVLDEEETLFAYITRLITLQQELDSLNARNDEIENLSVRLQQAQVADQLKGKYTLVEDARLRDKQAQAAVIFAQERLTRNKEELAKQKVKLDEAIAYQRVTEPRLKEREDALATAKVYEDQQQQYSVEFIRTQKVLAQRAELLATALRELKSTEERMQAVLKQAEKAETAIAQYSPGGTRLEQLKQVSPWLSNWALIQEQLLKNQQKLEKVVQEKLVANNNYQSIALKLEQAEVSLQTAQAALEAAETTNSLTIQKNHTVALRLTLHDGDSCPVCNNIYLETQLQPLPAISLTDTAGLHNKKTAAEKAQKAAHDAKTKAEATRESLCQKEQETRQDLAEVEANLSQLQQEISSVLHSDNWEINALKHDFEALQTRDTKYNQALVEQKETAAMLRETQQTLQSASNNYATALTEYEAATQERERWQHQLKEVELKLQEITGGQPAETLQQLLEREQQKLERQLQEVRESYQVAEKSAIQSEAEHKQASDAATAARMQKQQLQTDWDAALAATGFTEDSFFVAQADSQQQIDWQQEIANYNKRKVQKETQIQEVTGLVGNRTTSAAAINQRRDAKHTADQQFQQAQDQRVNLLTWIQEAAAKQKQANKLSDDLLTWKEQAQTYYILARNLKSDEFQAYVLEHLEVELVTRATVLLQELTDSRYTLKVQDKEYWVEDNWNGGEKRRVQTLSGGETFATSLSMALALSEKLSMGAELGSLFLDEGFGTLDAETLESVTQILESLRQQDRLIGVITHVRALGERLPTQVKVHKSPEGSKLLVEAF